MRNNRDALAIRTLEITMINIEFLVECAIFEPSILKLVGKPILSREANWRSLISSHANPFLPWKAGRPMVLVGRKQEATTHQKHFPRSEWETRLVSLAIRALELVNG